MESYRLLNEEYKIEERTDIDGNIEEVSMPYRYVQRQSDLAMIPCNLGNLDYVQYLEDAENGAEVLPYDYEAEEVRQIAAKQKTDEEKEIKKLIDDKIKQLAVDDLVKENKVKIVNKEIKFKKLAE